MPSEASISHTNETIATQVITRRFRNGDDKDLNIIGTLCFSIRSAPAEVFISGVNMVPVVSLQTINKRSSELAHKQIVSRKVMPDTVSTAGVVCTDVTSCDNYLSKIAYMGVVMANDPYKSKESRSLQVEGEKCLSVCVRGTTQCKNIFGSRLFGGQSLYICGKPLPSSTVVTTVRDNSELTHSRFFAFTLYGQNAGYERTMPMFPGRVAPVATIMTEDDIDLSNRVHAYTRLDSRLAMDQNVLCKPVYTYTKFAKVPINGRELANIPVFAPTSVEIPNESAAQRVITNTEQPFEYTAITCAVSIPFAYVHNSQVNGSNIEEQDLALFNSDTYNSLANIEVILK